MPTATDSFTLKMNAINPLRTTDWRWKYAQKLLNKSAPKCPESGDAWVNRAVRHLSADKTTPYLVRSDKARFDPRINEAFEIFSDEAQPKRRWHLEALLLTTEPLDQVAKRCGLPTATVEAYAELFFDVRRCLQATDWLLIKAVGSSPVNRFAGPQPGGLWKYFALFGGVLVLECCMAATGDADWPAWLPQAAGSDDPAVIERFKQKLKLTYRLQLAQTDEENAAIIEVMEQLRAFNDRPTTFSDEEFRDLRKAEAVLKSIPKLKRSHAERKKLKPRGKPQSDRTSTPPLPIDDPTQSVRKPK